MLRSVVLARLFQPSSKVRAIEICKELGARAPSRSSIDRRIQTWGSPEFGAGLSRVLASWAGIGPGLIVLYDVTTLYFETDKPDQLRRSGFSKERRVEPQVTVGLLTDGDGFPLRIEAYPGNMAETKTMVPHIRQFLDQWGLQAATIVADAGMFNDANVRALVAAGLDYILCMKISNVAWPIMAWKASNPKKVYMPGQVWTLDNKPHPPIPGPASQ